MDKDENLAFKIYMKKYNILLSTLNTQFTNTLDLNIILITILLHYTRCMCPFSILVSSIINTDFEKKFKIKFLCIYYS